MSLSLLINVTFFHTHKKRNLTDPKFLNGSVCRINKLYVYCYFMLTIALAKLIVKY